MTRSRSTTFMALAAVGVLVAACSSSTTTSTSALASASSAASSAAAATASASASAEESAAAGSEEVRIEGSVFEPGELTIAAGTEVLFVNADSFGHTITHGTDGDAVDDPVIDEEIAGNAEVPFTFEEPGTYEITCRLHPSMQMTITVEG